MSARESHILAEVRLALGSLPGVRLFRNNRGKAPNAAGRWVAYGLDAEGSSDLIGWAVVGGRAVFLAVEVKAPGARFQPGQINFIQQVNKSGGIGFVAYSAADAVEKLIAART